MAHFFSIHPKLRLNHVTYGGDVTVDEMKYVLMELSSHRDFSPAFHSLVEMDDCRFMFGADEQDELISLFEMVFSGGKGRSAIVLQDVDAAATAESHAENVKSVREMRVFESRSDALNWLGIAPRAVPSAGRLVEYSALAQLA